MLKGKMGESLKCEICQKVATVHLTQIIDNHIQKVDLCENCAKEKGVTDPSGFSLADLLAQPDITAKPSHEKMVCKHCGFSQSDFKRLGHLGCPVCYGSFREMIDQILTKMHKGTEHHGKVPNRTLQKLSLHDRINSLKKNLDLAIEEERYEDAAKHRDEINKIDETVDGKTDPR